MLHVSIIAVVLTGTWLPHAVPSRAVAVAGTPVDRAPGAAFAADASAALEAGGAIRAVEVWDRGDSLRLELTVARRDRAELYALTFGGDGERALAYERRAIDAPAEARVYRYADELAGLLARGAVESLMAECGAYFLEGAGGGASVDPYDYYVVASKARGVRARKLVGRALAGALDDGLALTAVARSSERPEGAVAAVDFVLFRGHEEIVHVGLDPMGNVIAAEVRWSPVPYRSDVRRFGADRELARALREAGGVAEIRIATDGDGGAPSLRLTLGSGARFAIEDDGFAADELALSDTGCPC